MLVAKEAEEALDLDEVISFVILILIAGNETTTNLIGNTAIALLDNPDQLAHRREAFAALKVIDIEPRQRTRPVRS